MIEKLGMSLIWLLSFEFLPQGGLRAEYVFDSFKLRIVFGVEECEC
jgi:hypothetical protein